MHLKSLSVKNFRGIEDINLSFSDQKLVNVIVGPNAVGKTTVLEAIRLTKGVLAPRTQSETIQVLTALGAASPHFQQRLFPAAIAREIDKPIEIRTQYELTVGEVNLVSSLEANLASAIIQSTLGLAAQGPIALVQYLSTPQGQATYGQALANVRVEMATLRASRTCDLELSIAAPNQISGAKIFPQAVIALLDGQQPTSRTLFSYFPADRAMPVGDVQIQIGPHDIGPQLESHNSQPQTKYNRLKNTIFYNLIQDSERNQLNEEFHKIFSAVLKGRVLDSVGINEIGFASIKVRDSVSGRVFELDGMSSGEKGLVLTFLLIGQSVSPDGVILLDEPELHLNPAVCKNVLSLLVDGYCKPKRIQAIICSHSPEILAAAFDRDDCALYHLISEKVITAVRRQDRDEIAQALRRLGSSETEELLYRGTIFVEGEHDTEILEAGFGDVLRRYKVKDLGGRREVEKQIKLLQDAEKKGRVSAYRYFIFDHDRAPAGLESTEFVKVLQWNRYCLENYLLDDEVIYDVLHEPGVATHPMSTLGEVLPRLKELAMSQLTGTVAKEIYERSHFECPGIRAHEFEGDETEKIADSIFVSIDRTRDQLKPLKRTTWVQQFVIECNAEVVARRAVWNRAWAEQCNGKRLLEDLHRSVGPKMSPLNFKKRIVAAMAARNRPLWESVTEYLGKMIASVEPATASTSKPNHVAPRKGRREKKSHSRKPVR
jgi:predicted ATPase